MAVNKNFVVKNGLEVGTDLILANTTNSRVGIGTSLPTDTLHVNGGIAGTDFVISGIATIPTLNSTTGTITNLSATTISMGSTAVINSARQLQNIASLDATTTATIESAIEAGPNTFANLNITGVSTFVGLATFGSGIEVKSGVSTFAGAVENVVSAGIVTALGFSGNITGAAATFTGDVSIGGTLTYEDVTNIDSVGIVTARAGVNVSGGQLLVGSGVTIGNAGVATFSGTSDVHLLDNVVLNIGDGSDLKLYHNGSNSYVTGANTGNLLLQAHGNIKLMPANGEDAVEAVANDAVKLYYNNSQ